MFLLNSGVVAWLSGQRSEDLFLIARRWGRLSAALGHGGAARERAERLWHPARIAGMVAEVYRQAMERGDQNPSSTLSLR